MSERICTAESGAGGAALRYPLWKLGGLGYELVVDAIAREKAIKGMAHAKKIALVKAINPRWEDLLTRNEQE